MQQEANIISDLLLVMVTAFMGGVGARFLRLPSVVGYLLSGVFLSGFAAYFHMGSSVSDIAYLGVALLLFSSGLAFSPQRLRPHRKIILFGALSQIAATILWGVFLLPWLGFDHTSSFIMAIAFALSSSVVSVKLLSLNAQLGEGSTEVASTWLLIQDIATLPLIVTISLAGINKGKIPMTWESIGLAAILTILVFLIGKKIVPPAIETIANWGGRELVLMESLILCLIFSILFENLRLPFALGAFTAGLLLSSSSVKHGIFVQIGPLRDLFSTVFFVSLGLMLKPSFLLSNALIIVLLVIVVMVIKFTISNILVSAMGFHPKIAFLTSLTLSNVGEFAFVVAAATRRMDIIDDYHYTLILAVSIVSIIVSVPFIYRGERLYWELRTLVARIIPHLIPLIHRLENRHLSETTKITDHIIVLGHGRVGKYISRALHLSDLPFVVVDFDHRVVKELRDQKIPVVYGDPADKEILSFASVAQARAVVVAYTDRSMQSTIISNVLSLNPTCKIIMRTHHESDQKQLKRMGVKTIVQPEFEAAVAIVEKLLPLWNISSDETAGRIMRLKIEHGMG